MALSPERSAPSPAVCVLIAHAASCRLSSFLPHSQICCPNPYKSVQQGSVGLVSKFGQVRTLALPKLKVPAHARATFFPLLCCSSTRYVSPSVLELEVMRLAHPAVVFLSSSLSTPDSSKSTRTRRRSAWSMSRSKLQQCTFRISSCSQARAGGFPLREAGLKRPLAATC